MSERSYMCVCMSRARAHVCVCVCVNSKEQTVIVYLKVDRKIY